MKVDTASVPEARNAAEMQRSGKIMLSWRVDAQAGIIVFSRLKLYIIGKCLFFLHENK